MTRQSHRAWRVAMRAKCDDAGSDYFGTSRMPGTGGRDPESEAVRAWYRDQVRLEAEWAAVEAFVPQLRRVTVRDRLLRVAAVCVGPGPRDEAGTDGGGGATIRELRPAVVNAVGAVARPCRRGERGGGVGEESEGPPLASGGPSAIDPEWTRKDGDCCANSTG